MGDLGTEKAYEDYCRAGGVLDVRYAFILCGDMRPCSMACSAGFSVPWLKMGCIHFAAFDSKSCWRKIVRAGVGELHFVMANLINIRPINSRVSLPEELREGLPFGSEPL